MDRFKAAAKNDSFASKLTRVDLSEPPARTKSGTWILRFCISVILIKVKIEEEFVICPTTGKIAELTRRKL